MTLQKWIDKNNLDVEFLSENLLSVRGLDYVFLVLEYKEELFDEDCFLLLSKQEYKFADKYEHPEKLNFLFEFGEQWYYCPRKVKVSDDGEDKYLIQLNDFLYLGKSKEKSLSTYLGIHSEYELLNSALNIKNCIKKANFLNVANLAICDKNTLAGTLNFQLECKKNGIRPLIGETFSVAYGYSKDKESQQTYDLKLFSVNEKGWFNLLTLNKILNVDFKGSFITEEKILEYSQGLICVFDYSNSILKELRDVSKYSSIVKKYQNHFLKVYYQFSSVEYSSDAFDLSCLNGFKYFLENFYYEQFPFLLIEDTYYLEPEQQECKISVNEIAKKVYQHSYEQYFKSFTQTIEKVSPLFQNSSISSEDFKQLCELHIQEFVDFIDFEISLEGSKLPKYEIEGKMLIEEESIELLRILCEEGFEKKVIQNFQEQSKIKEYRERLEREFKVITEAGFSDYFLIQWDTINFAIENNIMIGTGRGSIGGSLLAYLIGITRTDPIKYDLLFERFLNEARVKKQYKYVIKTIDGTEEIKDGQVFKIHDLELSYEELGKVNPIEIGVLSLEKVEVKRMDTLPDVDIDYTTSGRDRVKDYLKDKYGREYSCSVGTYGRLKLRQTFKDLAKLEGVQFSVANELTKKIDDQHEYEFFDLFKYAKKDEFLYKFIQKNPSMINKLKVILNNPKSVSIHPSAVLVLPKQDSLERNRNLSTWIPVREVDGNIVSEWEGKYCDIFGLLKNDILGLAQLDKFEYCLDLIERNTGKSIDLDLIPYDDSKTYRRFQKGFNEDVFQFGSRGLKAYSQEVKPDCIEDLIAMAALYRPGPMSSNAHSNFALIKHGKKKPEYDWGMKEITQTTNGLWVYQEQIMKAMVRAGFTLVESDEIRSVMKKFDKKKMLSVKEKFVTGLSKDMIKTDSFDKEEAYKESEKIWDKLVGFSSYGFNRSHSASYGLIAYQSQWLKSNYPLEFWTTSMNFGKEDVDIPYYLSEIKDIALTFPKSKQVKVASADINLSTERFECNRETNEILWSLTKIKGVAEKAVEKIISNRNRVGGKFHSLHNFLQEVPKKDVNKKILTNLIISGCFDRIEKINQPWERSGILLQAYEIRGISVEDCQYLNCKNVDKNWQWKIWEKELTGNGEIDYKFLLEETKLSDKDKKLYTESSVFKNSNYPEIKNWKFKDCPEVLVCGILDKFEIKKTRAKGKNYMLLFIQSNSVDIPVVLWDFDDSMLNKIQDNVGNTFYVRGIATKWASRNSVYISENISKAKLDIL